MRVDWAKRFTLYHNNRHPQEMGKQEIEDFRMQTIMIYTHVLNKGARGVVSPFDRI